VLLQKLNKAKGFTLIELLICVAIILILGAIIVPFLAGIAITVEGDSDQQVHIITQDEEQDLQKEKKVPNLEEEKSESKGEKKL
jgi:prepilin-type N-terminal cleavage/methylation domain-containing protein